MRTSGIEPTIGSRRRKQPSLAQFLTVLDLSCWDLSPVKYFLKWGLTIVNSFAGFVNRLRISSYVSSSCPQRPYGTLLSGRKPCTGQYIWVIDQDSSVKVAGFWSSFSFACFNRDPQSREKEWSPYPTTLTEQGWSIKDLLYGKGTLCSVHIDLACLKTYDILILYRWTGNSVLE